MQLATALATVQQEILLAVSTVQESDVDPLIAGLTDARRVFVLGTGRVGLAAQAFAQRLMHLGLTAHWIGDVGTPSLGPGDLLLVCSGSGETAAMRILAELAVQRGVRVATITRQPQASIGNLSETVVRLMASAEQGNNSVDSVQPMTSLFEQSLYVLLEAIVLMLMEHLGQTEAMMQQRHFNLER